MSVNRHLLDRAAAGWKTEEANHEEAQNAQKMTVFAPLLPYSGR
jgi:hypothetical protein